MSKSYRNNNALKGGGAVAMDPTAHLGNAAIHLGWLTVNLFLSLLRMHSEGRNQLQMCSLTVFMICVGFCTYLCLLRNHMLSRGSMGLNVQKSWIGLSATLLIT